MAWVYPSWPACSFTAELCVVHNSPTSIIDSPGIVTYLVAYLVATYVGPASKESSAATCHSTHARGIIYSTVF